MPRRECTILYSEVGVIFELVEGNIKRMPHTKYANSCKLVGRIKYVLLGIMRIMF